MQFLAKSDAFFAMGNKTASSDMISPIQFDKVFATSLSSFNKNSSSVSTVKTGLYWMHVAIDVPPNVTCDVYLSSLIINRILSLAKPYPLSGEDTISRDAIIKVQSGVDVIMTSNFTFQRAYWAGFRIDTMMSPLICFYVGRSTSVSTQGQITGFDQVLVNEGHGWNSTLSAFLTPRSGIYLFSFSVGITMFRKAKINLQVNGITVVTSCTGVGSAITTSSRCIMSIIFL